MHTIMTIIILLLIFFLIAVGIRNYLPKWFVCDLMQWHGRIKDQQTNYVHHSTLGDTTGICTKCGNKVHKDSQGNWF